MIHKYPLQKGYIYFGPRPNPNDLEYLKKENVNYIWNLLELELNSVLRFEKEKFNGNVICGNIPDYNIPKNKELFKEQLLFMHNQLKNGNNIFIHCFAGHGRTGMAVMGLLLYDGKQDAQKIAYELCSGPETELQIKFIQTLF